MVDYRACNSVYALARELGVSPERYGLPPEPPLSAAPDTVRAVDLPIGQRLALLTMRNAELARKVLAACKEALVHPPRLHHFTALVDAGYATRPGQYHRLTAKGSWAANDVAEAMARQLGIHHFVTGGGTRYELTVRCTCGWTASHSRNEGHWGSAQLRYRSRHLADVERRKVATLVPNLTESAPSIVPNMAASPP
jgi:predicted Rdx family selenoprotein